MLGGFVVLFIELGGLIAGGGLIVSALLVPRTVPNSISTEHALLLHTQ
jgi:hypothetical protein